MTARGQDRRTFFGHALGVVGFAAGLRAAGVVTAGVRWGVAHAEEPWAPIAGLPAEVTPVGKFYTVSKNVFDPSVDARTWKLAIKGKVGRPYSLTLDELRQLPAVTKPHTLMCISN